MKLRFLVLLCYLSIASSSFATHIFNNYVSWEKTSQDSILISISYVTDCSNSNNVGSQISVNYWDYCLTYFGTEYFPVTRIDTVERVCDSLSPGCSSGSYQGLLVYTYESKLFMPACDTFTFNYETCCRPVTVDNLVSPTTSYVGNVVTISNFHTLPNNGSPVFLNPPTRYIPANQSSTLSAASVDVDNDSIVYSLVPILGSGSVYQSPYSAQSPMHGGVSINAQTGEISLGGPLPGNYVINILVEEYDRATGAFKSSSYKDVDLVANSTSNFHQFHNIGGVSNFYSHNGNSFLTDNQINYCPGDSLSFDLAFYNSNTSIPIFVEDSLQDVFPGATISSQVVNGNLVFTLEIDQTTFADETFNPVSLGIKNDLCPYPSFAASPFVFRVLKSSANLGPDRDFCISDNSFILDTQSDTSISWMIKTPGSSTYTALSANDYDDLSALNNASKIEYPSAMASPLVLGDYYFVAANYYSGCGLSDTLKVSVSNTIGLNLDFVDSVCLNVDSVQLNTNHNYGTFSGLGITDSLTGYFNPSLLTGDSSWVNYSAVSPLGNCLTVYQDVIYVKDTVEANITDSVLEFCAHSQPFNLNAAHAGTWYGDLITDSLNGTISPNGTYFDQQVVLETNNGCLAYDTVVVEFYDYHNVTINNSQTPLCQGDTVSLDFTLGTTNPNLASLPPVLSFNGDGSLGNGIFLQQQFPLLFLLYKVSCL